MKPEQIAQNYNNIAKWWQEQHQDSVYGIEQLQRALQFCEHKRSALDVGCGAGGRFIDTLESNSFQIQGVDISSEMIALAQAQHPEHLFTQADICTYQSDKHFDLIVAWDSIFHLPYNEHVPVLKKLCAHLNPGGVLMYSFGDTDGEHEDQWHDMTFAYSSIGIPNNLATLAEAGLVIKHLEIDQWPEQHVYVIAQKPPV